MHATTGACTTMRCRRHQRTYAHFQLGWAKEGSIESTMCSERQEKSRPVAVGGRWWAVGEGVECTLAATLCSFKLASDSSYDMNGSRQASATGERQQCMPHTPMTLPQPRVCRHEMQRAPHEAEPSGLHGGRTSESKRSPSCTFAFAAAGVSGGDEPPVSD